ncbi:hypothetical protein X773_04890 [Mesorhizobium sp. LSJC285A00]|nr:hypothetical protein X773_04890 [Mesorhizobium sp. LSJC285A00]
MAEIGIKRFGAGDGEEDGADGDEGDIGRIDQEGDDVVRADRPQDFGIGDDVVQARKTDSQEPDRRDRAKDQRHTAGPEALHRKQDRQDDQRQRHDVGLEGRGNDIHAFNRRKHRDCRRDDGVTEEQ